jgi:hypothetical protein
LRLRLPLDRINVDKFPDDLRATCDQIADDELYTGQVWIFGRAKDAASTYYILTGIFKRRSPEPAGERRLYENLDNGLVFTVKGGKCGGGDPISHCGSVKTWVPACAGTTLFRAPAPPTPVQ